MDSNTLSVCDEDGAGKVFNSFEIDFETRVITVRDVITERVFQEVNECVAEKRRYALIPYVREGARHRPLQSCLHSTV